MSKQWTAIKGLEPGVVDFGTLDRERLESMQAAGYEVRECHRVLKKGGANIVGELLRGSETFYEYDHYPDGDVYDDETFSQYYYHAHRGLPGEHGHFHTFVRRAGIPDEIKPVPYDGDTPWPTDDDVICHFVAARSTSNAVTTYPGPKQASSARPSWSRSPAAMRRLRQPS